MARFHGTSVDYHLSLGETESARIFFTVHVEPGTQIPEIPYEDARGGGRAARPHLGGRPPRPPDRGLRPRARARARRRVRPRFPDYYKVVETDWEQVGVDVAMLERLRTAADGFVIGISNEATGERLTRVKLYKTGGKVDLSAFMPLLESLGLRAVEEVPDRGPGRGQGLHPRLRRARRARRGARTSRRESDLVREALTAMWRGEAEVDSLNRLVIFAGLVVAPGADPARLPQVPDARVDALHRGVPQRRARREPAPRRRLLVELFEAKFDPIRDAHATRRSRRCRQRIKDGPAERVVARPGHDHPHRSLGTIDGDRAHERLPLRPPGAVVQDPLGGRARDAEAVPAVRDLRVLAADGGDPPAGRAGRARRDPLVGPQGGLPHRGPRA